MKKRILSLLATILLFSLLLCSCAEGLPLSELALVLGEQTTLFSARVETLLTGAVPLATGGQSKFAVDWDRSVSAPLQSAISDFCAQFKAYSGVDLTKNDPRSAAHRILIGNKDEPKAKEILETLSPSAFYIGFSEKDLLILAHNDLMLCAALRYFSDTYLKLATEGKAQDVLLPKDFSHTAPTLICQDDEYTIVRAEKSGEGTVQAMSRLYEEIRATSGARPVRRTDYNYISTEKEILLGHPNTPKAQAILSTLSYDEYYIGVQGKTILILAHNDLMLDKAVTHFLSLFVNAKNAAANKQDKQMGFPVACDYRHTEKSILLAKDGVPHAVLIYPDDASKVITSAVNNLRALYKQLTNAELPAYADSQYTRVGGVFEILVGKTSRPESQKMHFEGIAKGEWRMAVDEKGEALVIGANGQFALRAALETLGSVLATQTAALSHESIYEEWWIKTDVDRLLYIFPSLAMGAQEVPDLIGAYTYSLSSRSYTMQQKDASNAQYEEYCALLVTAGFAFASEKNEEALHTRVYQSAVRAITVTYHDTTASLQVRVTTRWQRTQ